MSSEDKLKDLLANIKDSIVNDCGTAIDAFEAKNAVGEVGVGFFAVPRMLFPEIDGLGAILTGRSSATGLNIKTYLKTIMSKIDNRYAVYSGFMPLVYRHGLLHQHDPKRFQYGKKDFGWMFQFQNPNNPTDAKRRWHLRLDSSGLLILDMRIFYDDLVASIDLLMGLVSREQAEKYMKNYDKPINMTNALKRQKQNKKMRYLYRSDFRFLKQHAA